MAFYYGSRRQFVDAIEAYQKSLSSGTPVSEEETIKCHAAKLALLTDRRNKDKERRVRSIQTLALLGSKAAMPPGVRDLVRRSNGWPDENVEQLAWFLIDALRVVLAAFPPEEL